MPLLEWSDEMSVGLPDIDAQHQKIIAMINDLHHGVHEGRAREALEKVLNTMITYTHEHFRYEELLFEKTGYPETIAHKEEHGKLAEQVDAIKGRFKEGHIGILSIETAKFLKAWLTEHIMVSDKKYAQYFTQHNVM